ncbi:antitoxin/toxin system zeta toxin, signal recognition particle GTPase [Canicola haemoglobinophilus]|uniref:Antitoxin/toxin system zeta toxin, signal recognition particle GTPase n=1 Tax=Canicola haemoglobinophilus TaxID=733 RepID=A0A1V4B1B8_9PAST|nr:zeta toxin family protein [Canicola haemoglobinophilus]OOS00702.1 antitoxin/toxin system zeta toxin, signal recognition particle GTPase [Canicola haemoglobinophilus]STO60230.1 antitoxin/toxin system zeta toxin, signal recognition particle GTPase [Canicola haemoglobinophilus]
MAKDTKVNLSDVEEILKNEIKLNHLSSCYNPRVIFITGVSGSGKSTIIAKLKGNFIKIQSDNYRKLHPKIKDFKEKLGRNEAYKKTGNYSFEFAKKLCHQAIESRLNIVFEATFSKLETAKTLIDPFVKNGYEVVIVKLPINVDLSIERNQKRYKEKQAQEYMIPRITTREDIEKMADTYNETLDALEKIGIKIINLDTFSSEIIKMAL